MTEATSLPDVAPRWVTLRTPSGDLEAVTVIDEAVALAAPFPDHPVQLGIGVQLRHPDAGGQPGLTERPLLKAFEQTLVDLLAARAGARLVASITLDGIREYVFYAQSVEVLEEWRVSAPEELASHTFQARVLQDPGWLGLREIAGLLGPDEQPLRE